ncbi:hypothetical protein PRZ48_004339 [Zasmidium cellare]|uniref:S-adenosyl-L-methionine-dependent methyltransferase n=1 Tax=Zasmidium cellare TaxID=395010 RepID=A0ABR0EPD2_ZASCE|nr:hypothetical protein PRZ48_004339 [Zasmidium cellare]
MSTTDEGPYRQLLPSNVPTEHTRLDQQTRAITAIMGNKDFLTDLPSLPSPTRAIEVGAGTGLRTAVLAHNIPSNEESKIYAVDLSPIPSLHAQPNTIEFVQGNIFDLAGHDPRFGLGTFDFLTSRMLGAAITDWKAYIRAGFDLLKSGGRIELQEACFGWYDGEGNELSKGWRWLQVMRKAGPKIGLDFWGPLTFSGSLQEAGFVDVETQTFKWLISKEDEDAIAQYTAHVLNPTFVELVGRVVQKAGLGEGELEGLGDAEGVKRDYMETVMGAPKGTYCNFWVVRARKP